MPASVRDIQRYLRGQLDYADARYPGSLQDRWNLMKAAVEQVINRPDTIPAELMNVGDDIALDIENADALSDQTPKRGKTLIEVFSDEKSQEPLRPFMWEVFCQTPKGDDDADNA